MEMTFQTRERIVGVFLLLVILLLLATVAVLGRGRGWFRSTVSYYTTFAQAYNLSEKAPVKMSKTQIGKVKKIDLSGEDVRVDLDIWRQYAPRIRQGSVATVESPTIIGDQYVSITPGPGTAPQIPEGGEIPSRARKTVQDILEEFQLEETGKNVVRAVQQITEIVDRLHDPQGPLFSALKNANQSLVHIESLLAGIEKGEGTIGAVLKSDTLVRDLDRSLANIQQILENVEKSTRKVPATVDDVQKSLALVNELVASLNQATSTVQQILKNVEKASYDFPKVTQSAGRGINEMRDSMAGVDQVVQSIKNNPLIRGNLPPEPTTDQKGANPRP
ncbi:MAG: MlaD family protein [Thermodesulfobacteriota bacterium]